MAHLFTDSIQSNKKDFIQLTQDVLEANTLIVGETHGVQENAYLYYSLFKLFEFETLVLTYPNTLEASVKNYVQTGVFPIHKTMQTMTDGNVNKTYLLMMKHLYSENLLKNIIFIDDDEKRYQHWNDSQKASFNIFKNEYDKNSKTLIILSQAEVETSPFQKGEELMIPIGFHLEQHLGKLPLCRLYYHSGQYYSFGQLDFPKTPMPSHMLHKRSSVEKQYELHLDKVSPVASF